MDLMPVFKRMDCDSNGEITLREFVLWHKPRQVCTAFHYAVALALMPVLNM